MTRLRLILFAVLTGLAWALPARAMDYQIHGFAAQAYLVSEGNNYFGDSTNGSHDFYEAAVNGSVNPGHGLLASAQVLIRDAGLSDTGKPRLDYALLDWNAIQGVKTSAGIRVGRVKNTLGLYNDTRDVIFARPGILLPQSVYFDSTGLRGIFFSSDGAQLYGVRTQGAHELSLSFNAALNRDFSRKERQILFSSAQAAGQPEDIRLHDLFFMQLADAYDGGRITLALSHARAKLSVDPEPEFPVEADLNANLYVASARYNAERFSVTAEYLYVRSKTRSEVLGDTTGSSDGGYLQGDYRLTPQWTVFGRYDASFSDADDRDGREAVRSTGVERFSRFAHDLVLGVSWRPDDHWGIWAECHRIYGTSTASALDNPDGADDERWTLLTVMAGYRF